MPQIMLLKWWIVFIYFIIILFKMSIINYYIILYTPTSVLKNKLINKSSNWKWYQIYSEYLILLMI